eukprot:m.168920 g.168920  ORF g.168920 m.168920 type:complete len:59 (-) comp17796_c3_seq8:1717-1893(-)
MAARPPPPPSDELCCVCRENTSYPGFNPKARLQPGSLLGPAWYDHHQAKPCVKSGASK